MIRALKVFVTGSSELPPEHVGFAEELGERLMKETGFVLVTGGLSSKGQDKRTALDKIVVNAACRALKGAPESVRSRIVTILPGIDTGVFERFSIGTIVHVAYADSRVRRHSMVLTSDAVVAINGSGATKEVIDLAYVAGKPLIPIPITGGSALECWNKYENELIRRLRLSSEEVDSLKSEKNLSCAVSMCLKLISRALRPRCFVAMPFTDHPLPNVFETIRSAAEEQGYQVIRLDQEIFTGNIVEVIWESIRNCDLVIVDLTNHKPNVYYEMGISHALGKPTLLSVYSHDGNVPNDIPFDIKVQRIIPYGTLQSLRCQLKSHLSANK